MEPKEFAPPAVWIPSRLAKQVAGVAIAPESWGPIAGQLLIADGEGGLLRVQLEQVNGEWQGAAWPLVTGLGARATRLALIADGRLYFSGAAADGRGAGIGHIAPAEPKGFAVKSVKTLADGYELTFTEPVNPASASKPTSYEIAQFNYRHSVAPGAEHNFAGAPGRSSPLKANSASVAVDGSSVRLTVPGLRLGFVTSIRAAGVRSATAQPLRSDTFFHTLNQVPK